MRSNPCLSIKTPPHSLYIANIYYNNPSKEILEISGARRKLLLVCLIYIVVYLPVYLIIS